MFGLAPDPTVLATLGVLLLLPPRAARGGAARRPTTHGWLWPLPLLWCGVTGTTLATMHAADALVLPAAALVALVVRLRPAVT